MGDLNKRLITENELKTQKRDFEKLSNGIGIEGKSDIQTYSLGVMMYVMKLVRSANLNSQNKSLAGEIQKISNQYFSPEVLAGMEKVNKNREKELEKDSNISQEKLSKDKEKSNIKKPVYNRLSNIIWDAKQKIVQSGNLKLDNKEKPKQLKENGEQQKNEPISRV